MTQVLHTHCPDCYTAKCTERPCPPYSCEMTSCELRCGAQFHACKLSEHKRCCSKEMVSCINSIYGCPLMLPRSQTGVHLRVCPASVIQCGTEWNRWPVYSPERKARVPFAEKQYHARYGQLDVALALRDQRMLERSLQAPRSTRRALRNNLTRRFPAVPILMKARSVESEGSVHDVTSGSDDDSDAPWNQAKQPPGLVASVCNELFRTKPKTEPQDNAANNSGTSGLNGSGDNLQTDSTNQTPQASCDSQDTLSTDQSEQRTADSITDQLTDLQKDHISEMLRMKKKAMQKAANAEDLGGTNIPEPPHDFALMLQEILSLDLNMEFVTRYQAKPKSMYTFLCAQPFRRDEYPWHVKNVHADILSSLDGWLEQRCPLAREGCTYSFRRMHPGKDKGSMIVYNDIVESFGIRPAVPTCLMGQRESQEREYAEYVEKTRGKESTPEIMTSQDYRSSIEVSGNLDRKIPDRRAMSKSPGRDLRPDPLTSLPAELIQHIARFLDGFSLCNLSLTCTLLRSVCCTLLEEKGIVVQEWIRKGGKQNPSWVKTEQRWLFSTAFEPVKSWGFLDYPHLSEHLKTCAFNKPLERHVPVAVIPTKEEDRKDVADVLKRMYPNAEFPLKEEFQFPSFS